MDWSEAQWMTNCQATQMQTPKVALNVCSVGAPFQSWFLASAGDHGSSFAPQIPCGTSVGFDVGMVFCPRFAVWFQGQSRKATEVDAPSGREEVLLVELVEVEDAAVVAQAVAVEDVGAAADVVAVLVGAIHAAVVVVAVAVVVVAVVVVAVVVVAVVAVVVVDVADVDVADVEAAVEPAVEALATAALRAVAAMLVAVVSVAVLVQAVQAGVDVALDAPWLGTDRTHQVTDQVPTDREPRWTSNVCLDIFGIGSSKRFEIILWRRQTWNGVEML